MANPVNISFARSDSGGSANLYGSVTATYTRVGSTVKIVATIKVTSWAGKYAALDFNGETVIRENTGTVTRTFSYDNSSAKTYTYPVSVYIQTATNYAGYTQSYSLTIDVPAAPTGSGIVSQVRVNSAWKQITGMHVKVSGSWKKVNDAYVKVNGAWKKCVSKATITIYGGASESVTYSGPDSGTITLNSSGVGTKEVTSGSYTFRAALSGRTSTNTVTGNTSIYLRPTNFIYWYGVEAVAFGSITGNDYSPAVKRNTNSITVSTYRSGQGTNYRAFYTNTAVAVTNYSSLKGILEGMAVNGWYKLGAATSRTTYDASSGAAVAVNKPSITTVSLSGITGNRYIGIMGDSYGKAGDIVATIHAIWME